MWPFGNISKCCRTATFPMWTYGHIGYCGRTLTSQEAGQLMELHTVNDVGAVVRSARRQNGLTQADLARQAGVSREWLVRLEHGHPRLEMQLVLDTLSALGLALNVVDSRSDSKSQDTAWDDLFVGLTKSDDDNG
ncbi:helix-turn-helix transcriptional regulator [Kribbella sp. CA-294648]|uniref:helix-turn-helix transcriptional regulator n=1 Tax=Kribbella sp. CA-294648 TaxID=3239948 RepID=UPI003D8E0A31